MKKIAILGAGGQLGTCLRKTSPLKNEVFYYTSAECDITNPHKLRELCHVSLDYIINAAAFTNVDGAETDKERAFTLNDTAVGVLADICAERSITLLHISTDFVFDGKSKTPYTVDAPTNPISVYGVSKRAGEKRVLAASSQHRVIRTSWLYSPWKNNFVKTMLRLMNTRDSISVVADEIGSPTSALSLAQYIWDGIEKGEFDDSSSILHFCNTGVVSRYDFASEIYQRALAHSILTNSTVSLSKTTAAELALPAPRPAYSALESSATNSRPWQEELDFLFKEYATDWLATHTDDVT